MPTCEQCHHKWTWGDTIKRTFRKKKKCPYCGEIQYTTFKSTQRMSWFGLIIPIIFIGNSLLGWQAIIGTMGSAIILLIGFITQPFLTTLNNEEELPR